MGRLQWEVVAPAGIAYNLPLMAEFKRTPRQKQGRTHRDDEADTVASLFPGSREEAVAEGRADRDADRIYDAESVERWIAGWHTYDETDLPSPHRRALPPHDSGSAL